MRRVILMLMLVLGMMFVPVTAVTDDGLVMPVLAMAVMAAVVVIPAVRDGPASVPRDDDFEMNSAAINTMSTGPVYRTRLARTTGKHLDVLPNGPQTPVDRHLVMLTT